MDTSVKIISILIPVDLEYRVLWSKAKGYTETINSLNPETGLAETIANPVSLEDFFQDNLKRALFELAINPINNLIYSEINRQAQSKIDELNTLTQTKLKIEIKNV